MIHDHIYDTCFKNIFAILNRNAWKCSVFFQISPMNEKTQTAIFISNL